MAFGQEWFGKANTAEKIRQQELEMLVERQKLDYMQMQANLLAAHQDTNIYTNTTTSPAYQTHIPQQYHGIGITTSSTGIGNYIVGSGAPTYVGPLPQQQVGQHYYVALPTAPVAGDKITVHFDGLRWLEDRNCPSETAQLKRPEDHTGFSLTELEEAQKILDECGVAA